MAPIRIINLAALAGILAIGSSASAQSYAYGSKTFRGFVDDSFKEIRGDSATFYRSFEGSFQKVAGKSPTVFVDSAGRAINAVKGASRAQAEINLGRDLHRIIKKSIPKFSLDRGFEFYQTARLGERQCFLQAVLIAGLMQRAKVDAGVVMVYRNERGETSNNGHAVTLLRLSDRRLLVVDASEPHAFATHHGLFVKWAKGGYRFLKPEYAKGSTPTFTSVRFENSPQASSTSEIRLLDIPFLRSQFDYYRGERTPNGFLAKKATPAGLASSKRFLLRATQHSSQNPLAVYILGRVEERLGEKDLAAKSYKNAIALYAKFGWTPGGVKESLARVVKA